MANLEVVDTQRRRAADVGLAVGAVVVLALSVAALRTPTPPASDQLRFEPAATRTTGPATASPTPSPTPTDPPSASPTPHPASHPPETSTAPASRLPTSNSPTSSPTRRP